MKLHYDYLALLENQCDCIYPKTDLRISKQKFSEICRNLSRDFLPPVEREDIAALSYSLLDIASKIENEAINSVLKKQLSQLKTVLGSFFNKGKTCGEDIRRLIDINIGFVAENQSQKQINDSISEFLKTVLSAYFRNI